MKIGRNDLCPCGSGKKYKKCCLYKSDQKKDSKDTPNQSEEQSMFPGIENEAKEICNALNKRRNLQKQLAWRYMFHTFRQGHPNGTR